MNPLFWSIVAALAIALGFQAWWWRRRDSESRGETPVDELAFTRDEDWPLEGDEWSLKDVEFLAGAGRTRAVVTTEMRCKDGDRRRRALQKLAREIYRHTEVEAVFVQADRPGHRPDLHLFAADGRGWWGQEVLSTATSGQDF